MRPRHESVRDQLPALLRRNPGASAPELTALANTSPATMLRALKEAAADVVRVGKAGRTRYYLSRTLRGHQRPLPLYRIDTQGQASQVGTLRPLAPAGCHLDVQSLGWPAAPEFANGVWPGLPYPLQDMWPQGFLGRNFARYMAAELSVPDNPRAWSNDDVVVVLAQRGSDCTGDLVLGDGALERWLLDKAQAAEPMSGAALAKHYVQMADHAASLGEDGSSAAGEFPKFTAVRALTGDLVSGQTPHVIVKFSGQERSGTVQRWSDLLVCEHLALQTLQGLGGVFCANSRLLQHGGRTFLEVERFDRLGMWGRSPLCSLATLEASIISTSSAHWVVLAQAMVDEAWLVSDCVRQVQLISSFGTLIHNNDMHKGNLSFVPGTPMRLAPVYDMLPMAYAPLPGGELPGMSFAPLLPMPKWRDVWLQACAAALQFWQLAATDVRISAAFRAICADNRLILDKLRDVC